jgi:hypothetical protein
LGDERDEPEGSITSRAAEDLSPVDPCHQLGPGVVPRGSSLLFFEKLEIEGRLVRLAPGSRAGPAKGDDLVSVVGALGETAMMRFFCGLGS